MRKVVMALGIVSALFSAFAIWWALSRWGWPGEVGPRAGDFLVLIVGIGVGVIEDAMLGRFDIWGLYSLWGFLCSLMAIAGGVISLDRPTRAGILMLLSAIGGGVLTFTIIATMRYCWPGAEIFYFMAAFALIPGGVCALVSRTVEGPAWIIAATIIFLGIGGGLMATLGGFAVLYYPIGGVLFLLIVGGALARARGEERRAKNSQRP